MGAVARPCLREQQFFASIFFPSKHLQRHQASLLFPSNLHLFLIKRLSPKTDLMALSIAVPSDSPPSTFTRSLEEFRRRLSAEDLENFEFTSFESLELAIKETQKDQAQRRALRNLNKIKPFLCFLQDYARVIEQFVSAKPDFLAFIWVRINASPSSSLPSTDIS